MRAVVLQSKITDTAGLVHLASLRYAFLLYRSSAVRLSTRSDILSVTTHIVAAVLETAHLAVGDDLSTYQAVIEVSLLVTATTCWSIQINVSPAIFAHQFTCPMLDLGRKLPNPHVDLL